jgi:hypothetical protein
MTGTAPTPRDNYSQCLIDDRWFVHGGNDVFRELKNDTYQFNFHTGAWSVVSNVTRIACMPLNTPSSCLLSPSQLLPQRTRSTVGSTRLGVDDR